MYEEQPLALLNKDIYNHFVGKIKQAFGGNLALQLLKKAC
jgi:hypothetical protein